MPERRMPVYTGRRLDHPDNVPLGYHFEVTLRHDLPDQFKRLQMMLDGTMDRFRWWRVVPDEGKSQPLLGASELLMHVRMADKPCAYVVVRSALGATGSPFASTHAYVVTPDGEFTDGALSLTQGFITVA